MRRLVLALLLCLLPVGAHALNCPEVITDCPTMNANDANIGGKLTARSIVFLSAVDYGVKADAVIDQTTGAFISGTSDDTALRAALDDCAAKNATLLLPPRPILIDGTGGVTAMIQNCAVVGTSQHGGMYSEPKGGTLILLRSKTVAPFHIRNDWEMRGVAFFHPDQVGAGATFTGSVTSTTLTTTAVTAIGGSLGGIKPGYLLVGFGVPLGTHIVSQTGGTTGGAGTYTLDAGMPTRTNIQMSVSKPADQYPPVLSDDSTVGAGHFLIDNVTFVNPYDAIVGTPNRGWGAFFITNLHGWALHDLIAPGFIGDTFHVGNVQLSPGAWFGMTGQSTATKLAINYGEQQNSIFHVQGPNLPWQVVARQIGGEAWRWGFRVDNSNVHFTQSMIDIAGDSLGTVLQVPEGSSFYGFNTVIKGSAGCNVVDWVNGSYVGVTSCFELSSTSSLILSEFLGYAQGDAVVTNGAPVKINGGEFQAGGAFDGSDRAIVRLTADTALVQVQNAYVLGVACSQDASQCHHVRGIDTAGFSATNLQVQNNVFDYFENSIKLKTSAYTLISGNRDSNIAGLSVLASGTGGAITWGGNNFEKPPLASVSACGGGATITGTLSGIIVVGSGTVTSCQLTVPFSPTGNVVSAWAQDGTALTIAPSAGATAVIGSVAGANLSGKAIMFDWRGFK